MRRYTPTSACGLWQPDVGYPRARIEIGPARGVQTLLPQNHDQHSLRLPSKQLRAQLEKKVAIGRPMHQNRSSPTALV